MWSAVAARRRRLASELGAADGRLLLGTRSADAYGGLREADEAAGWRARRRQPSLGGAVRQSREQRCWCWRLKARRPAASRCRQMQALQAAGMIGCRSSRPLARQAAGVAGGDVAGCRLGRLQARQAAGVAGCRLCRLRALQAAGIANRRHGGPRAW